MHLGSFYWSFKTGSDPLFGRKKYFMRALSEQHALFFLREKKNREQGIGWRPKFD